MRRRASEAAQRPDFYEALAKQGISCICEVKKASPSKGLIRPDFQPLEIAAEYERAGADAISCLTEESYFQGSSLYLQEIAEHIGIPVLRKDFIFDEYQIYEAKALGASAVLLIAAILSVSQMQEYLALAHELGLECLVEVHNPEEMEKAQHNAPRILGINNRDLKTFHVDLQTTAQLADYAQSGQLLVSESGIRDNGDMQTVRKNGADAVLIGETLMRSSDITATLHALREGIA
jgi:indole-3-glycerol phosphate synthase